MGAGPEHVPARTPMKALPTSCLTLVLLLGGGAARAAPSVCALTAQDLWQSCREGARDDVWTQRALCVNETSERDACLATARGAFDDARGECDDQHDARLDL